MPPMRGRGMGRRGRPPARQVRRTARRRRRRRTILVGGLVAFGAYKMSTRDAERIEEHTGIPPEEMTDQELEQAMDDLGIEQQRREASDVEAGATDPQITEGSTSYLDELERLGQLKDEGIITTDEFEAKKRQLLGLD